MNLSPLLLVVLLATLSFGLCMGAMALRRSQGLAPLMLVVGMLEGVKYHVAAWLWIDMPGGGAVTAGSLVSEGLFTLRGATRKGLLGRQARRTALPWLAPGQAGQRRIPAQQALSLRVATEKGAHFVAKPRWCPCTSFVSRRVGALFGWQRAGFP